MKNLYLATILLFSVMTFGQKRHGVVHTNGISVSVDTTAAKTSKWSKYVGVDVSISNGNSYENNANSYTFQESAYPSVEFGFSRENLSLSGVIGRGNFKGMGSHSDAIGNYYWELKATPTFPLGIVNASLIFGAGTYFNNQVGNGFIEYGSGISYTVGKYTYGVSYTNWDGIDYITPNISYVF
jgi:hypothetical protein